MRLLCIHSLTAHGIVGMKPFLAAWGERCLPVPSVVLSGPGNMPGVERMPTDLARLLDSTLAAVAARRERVAVFVGYLAHAGQVEAVEACLERWDEPVAALTVDPVCGDDGRAYVEAPLVAAWPRLLDRAAVALPNQTELSLLTGASGEQAVTRWRERFPRMTTVVTGVPAGDDIETRVLAGDKVYRLAQRRRPGHFSGTGDHFAAWWLREVHLRGASVEAAALAASEAVGRAIDTAMAGGSRDLPLPGPA